MVQMCYVAKIEDRNLAMELYLVQPFYDFRTSNPRIDIARSFDSS